jgi:hypothetical protein
MTDGINPAAPHHIPFYITGPDGSDPLFTTVVVFLLVMFLAAGVIYFKLHSLPEHMGAKQNSAQLQLISILAVLALFTHNNLFWVLALLIAVIRIPDFLTPLETIARSLQRMAADGRPDALEASGPEMDPRDAEDGQSSGPPPDSKPLSKQPDDQES